MLVQKFPFFYGKCGLRTLSLVDPLYSEPVRDFPGYFPVLAVFLGSDSFRTPDIFKTLRKSRYRKVLITRIFNKKISSKNINFSYSKKYFFSEEKIFSENFPNLENFNEKSKILVPKICFSTFFINIFSSRKNLKLIFFIYLNPKIPQDSKIHT